MKISVIEGDSTLSTFKPVEVNGIDNLTKLITTTSYSLGTFADNHRTNKNFQGSHFVGLDFDNGLSLKEAQELFKDQWHIIATTKSHQKEKNKVICDRFRVILKTKELIKTQEDYKATVLNLMEKYPSADKACSDAARFFFPSNKIISFNETGKLIEVKKYIKPETNKTEVSNYMKGELSRKTLEFIAFGAKAGSWNQRLFQAAIDCNEQKYTKEETISILKPATANYEGDFDSNDLGTIDSAFNRDPKHPPRKVETCFNFKHPTEISAEAGEVPWLVEGLLIAGGISIFAGAPKSGKSTITRQLAMAVSRGEPLFGRSVKRGNVLYLALEEQENLIGAQLKNLGLNKTDNIMMHIGPMGNGNVNDNLKAAIESYKADLVVIDTLLLLACFDNPNDYNETYKVVSKIRNIARETGAHIILIHHKNKNEDQGANSVLGSTALQGAVDSTMLLNNIPRREFYRRLNTYQRGGQRFVDQLIRYIPEKDVYELAKDEPIDF